MLDLAVNWLFMFYLLSLQMSYKRNIFKLCSCGSLQRNAEFHKHVNKREGHTVAYQMVACVPCREFAPLQKSNKDFYETHSTCASGEVTEPGFHRRFMELRQEALNVSYLI